MPLPAVTQLLHEAQGGDPAAFDRLLPLVYGELRRLAARELRRERPGHTLRPTALVHEEYFKLAGHDLGAESRAHFLRIAARAMRQVLVDHARARQAQKRGGRWVRVTFDAEGPAGGPARLDEVVALDAALDRLDAVSERLRSVVEMRFFGGLTEVEIADALGVTTRTVQRDWAKARAWLYRELYPDAGPRPAALP
ncbi:MAG: sigma-70 family RNA polymerase sigma factor [Rhodothermales bacterium]|nr:sigma-70 family RNA polymerase sigma factor [Rhodothermales bacterium]